MKKSIVFIGGILLIISGLFAVVAPDKLSMAIVGVMGLTTILGFVFGIVPLLQYISAFKQGVRNLDEVKKVNTSNPWIPVSQMEPFFDQKALDALETLDPRRLCSAVSENRISMCGVQPAAFILDALRRAGRLSSFRKIGHTTSAAASGDTAHVVGYAGYLFL